MNRSIIVTGDGSSTLYVPGLDEHYHSVHGALSESMHVFIGNGLNRIAKDPISILEIGFGTGLNACLTFDKLKGSDRRVYYESWEKYPLTEAEYEELNYTRLDGLDESLFRSISGAPWNQEVQIYPNGFLKKIEADIMSFTSDRYFDLVYFDAFGPDCQPDLWTADVFTSISSRQLPGSILTTYSVKGIVRRNLAEAGYQVKKVPGPKGKREITLATKK
jgi:tRNA U34 5-methylaminomethyl-2-thiouridine-forming methyltransferase MnmC